jgi:hypothetical protein
MNLRWLAAALLLLNTLPLLGQNQAPRPIFTWAPTCDVTSVNFDASGSYDPDGSIASYEWDFGDGTPWVTTTSPWINHYYSYGYGPYDVTLWVTDNNGLGGEYCYTYLNVWAYSFCG